MSKIRRIWVKNLKTEKEYPISQDTLAKINARGMSGKYTIIREEDVDVSDGPTFIPQEVTDDLNNVVKEEVRKSNK